MNKPQGRLAYSWLYKTKEWIQLRESWLRFNCWCVMCQEIGIRKRATVVDHKVRHAGNRTIFFDRTNLQSLCPSCHNSAKQRMEKSGKVRPAVGLDGWPTQTGGEGGYS
jgi:5-methylcytosine-specific restriction endonuclease McrA